MAEKQKAVAAQEKVAISKRDPWALKKWFSVYAPPYLGGVFLAEVPAAEAQKLVKRTLEVTLYDITKDISHLPIKLRFQIHRVDGLNASTRFKGLELTRDYLRSLIRRGTSKIMAITDVKTKDGWVMGWHKREALHISDEVAPLGRRRGLHLHGRSHVAHPRHAPKQDGLLDPLAEL